MNFKELFDDKKELKKAFEKVMKEYEEVKLCIYWKMREDFEKALNELKERIYND